MKLEDFDYVQGGRKLENRSLEDRLLDKEYGSGQFTDKFKARLKALKALKQPDNYMDDLAKAHELENSTLSNINRNIRGVADGFAHGMFKPMTKFAGQIGMTGAQVLHESMRDRFGADADVKNKEWYDQFGKANEALTQGIDDRFKGISDAIGYKESNSMRNTRENIANGDFSTLGADNLVEGGLNAAGSLAGMMYAPFSTIGGTMVDDVDQSNAIAKQNGHKMTNFEKAQTALGSGLSMTAERAFFLKGAGSGIGKAINGKIAGGVGKIAGKAGDKVRNALGNTRSGIVNQAVDLGVRGTGAVAKPLAKGVGKVAKTGAKGVGAAGFEFMQEAAQETNKQAGGLMNEDRGYVQSVYDALSNDRTNKIIREAGAGGALAGPGMKGVARAHNLVQEHGPDVLNTKNTGVKEDYKGGSAFKPKNYVEKDTDEVLADVEAKKAQDNKDTIKKEAEKEFYASEDMNGKDGIKNTYEENRKEINEEDDMSPAKKKAKLNQLKKEYKEDIKNGIDGIYEEKMDNFSSEDPKSLAKRTEDALESGDYNKLKDVSVFNKGAKKIKDKYSNVKVWTKDVVDSYNKEIIDLGEKSGVDYKNHMYKDGVRNITTEFNEIEDSISKIEMQLDGKDKDTKDYKAGQKAIKLLEEQRDMLNDDFEKGKFDISEALLHQKQADALENSDSLVGKIYKKTGQIKKMKFAAEQRLNNAAFKNNVYGDHPYDNIDIDDNVDDNANDIVDSVTGEKVEPTTARQEAEDMDQEADIELEKKKDEARKVINDILKENTDKTAQDVNEITKAIEDNDINDNVKQKIKDNLDNEAFAVILQVAMDNLSEENGQKLEEILIEVVNGDSKNSIQLDEDSDLESILDELNDDQEANRHKKSLEDTKKFADIENSNHNESHMFDSNTDSVNKEVKDFVDNAKKLAKEVNDADNDADISSLSGRIKRVYEQIAKRLKNANTKIEAIENSTLDQDKRFIEIDGRTINFTNKNVLQNIKKEKADLEEALNELESHPDKKVVEKLEELKKQNEGTHQYKDSTEEQHKKDGLAYQQLLKKKKIDLEEIKPEGLIGAVNGMTNGLDFLNFDGNGGSNFTSIILPDDYYSLSHIDKINFLRAIDEAIKSKKNFWGEAKKTKGKGKGKRKSNFKQIVINVAGKRHIVSLRRAGYQNIIKTLNSIKNDLPNINTLSHYRATSYDLMNQKGYTNHNKDGDNVKSKLNYDFYSKAEGNNKLEAKKMMTSYAAQLAENRSDWSSKYKTYIEDSTDIIDVNNEIAELDGKINRGIKNNKINTETAENIYLRNRLSFKRNALIKTAIKENKTRKLEDAYDNAGLLGNSLTTVQNNSVNKALALLKSKEPYENKEKYYNDIVKDPKSTDAEKIASIKRLQNLDNKKWSPKSEHIDVINNIKKLYKNNEVDYSKIKNVLKDSVYKTKDEILEDDSLVEGQELLDLENQIIDELLNYDPENSKISKDLEDNIIKYKRSVRKANYLKQPVSGIKKYGKDVLNLLNKHLGKDESANKELLKIMHDKTNAYSESSAKKLAKNKEDALQKMKEAKHNLQAAVDPNIENVYNIDENGITSKTKKRQISGTIDLNAIKPLIKEYGKYQKAYKYFKEAEVKQMESNVELDLDAKEVINNFESIMNIDHVSKDITKLLKIAEENLKEDC